MVQLIDTPPITPDFLQPYMYGFIRAADLVLLMVDCGRTTESNSATNSSSVYTQRKHVLHGVVPR